ncbi:MAG: hypothetical protein U9N82_05465 [Thermodesulfobacteriota bacterium]|nr:hypothetical protein [Thermodesulfobacteriota bacterium]
MGFTVEQECPQCGAPIELDETDHVLHCPYCGINNFLFAPHYYRFVLQHKAPDKKIIYVPYLRFKGNVYFCMDRTVSHRIVDITHVGVSFKSFPISLGVRPQAMKVILAGSAINKKKVLPLLPNIRFKIKNYNLIYLPFRDTGHEMIQEQMEITINKKALEFGRFL